VKVPSCNNYVFVVVFLDVRKRKQSGLFARYWAHSTKIVPTEAEACFKKIESLVLQHQYKKSQKKTDNIPILFSRTYSK
jgi:hypothetical protein